MAKNSQDLGSRIGNKAGANAPNGPKSNTLLRRIGPSNQTKSIKPKPTPRANSIAKPISNRFKTGNINPLLAALTTDNKRIRKSNESKVSKPEFNGRGQRRALVQQQEQQASRSPLLVPTQPKILRNQTILKIKNASTPHFLKIKNLEYGTTANDLNRVLGSIGVIDIIKVKDLPSGSAIAEVLFKNPKHLEEASSHLNGAIADGRVIEALVTNESEMNLISEEQPHQPLLVTGSDANSSILRRLKDDVLSTNNTKGVASRPAPSQKKIPTAPKAPKAALQNRPQTARPKKARSLADRLSIS